MEEAYNRQLKALWYRYVFDMRVWRLFVLAIVLTTVIEPSSRVGANPVSPSMPAARSLVPLQPLKAQVARLMAALDYIGAPLAPADRAAVEAADGETNEVRANAALQDILDQYSLFNVHINPESRVSVKAGSARPELVQNGWRTFLVKVYNEAGVTAPLQVDSPQAAPVFSRGPKDRSLSPRPPQTVGPREVADRWLDIGLFDKPPMRPTLSGLLLEYRIVQLYSRDAGQRAATISINVGRGTQDVGFRNDVAMLFRCQPAYAVRLRILDDDGTPSTARFIIRDHIGRIYPSPAKRLAPDFPFHDQVYRSNGEQLVLPQGRYDVEFSRGPEYVQQNQTLVVNDSFGRQSATFKLRRWINPVQWRWYSGDHHVHAAGCAHYETPTQGVFPADIFRSIAGEGLNIGAVLTWGPGYYFQKQFFDGRDHPLSTPQNRMRYDLEVSGFPSSHSGHLVLLRLRDQDYPGAKVLEDWPTWNLPILQWARAQGAVVGYAHTGWGLAVEDSTFPTLEVPKFDGVGANEFIVDVTHDVVDFISTVDTPAHWELNMWYHTLNVGFRVRVAGETDFPCIYDDRVGRGRSYAKVAGAFSYDSWVNSIRAGRSYVTDGKSHLLDFRVNGQAVGDAGGEMKLEKPSDVRVVARVAARLEAVPRREIRQLPLSKAPYWDLERARIGDSRSVPVELIVNGKSVATRSVVGDGTVQNVRFDVRLAQSSWIALRILPSSHTNPVFAIVEGKPIRASRASAEWCLAGVDRCWTQKATRISAAELPSARRAYDHARNVYRRRIAESEQ